MTKHEFSSQQLELLAKKREAQRALEEEEKTLKSKPAKPVKGEEVLEAYYWHIRSCTGSLATWLSNIISLPAVIAAWIRKRQLRRLRRSRTLLAKSGWLRSFLLPTLTMRSISWRSLELRLVALDKLLLQLARARMLTAIQSVVSRYLSPPFYLILSLGEGGKLPQLDSKKYWLNFTAWFVVGYVGCFWSIQGSRTAKFEEGTPRIETEPNARYPLQAIPKVAREPLQPDQCYCLWCQ